MTARSLIPTLSLLLLGLSPGVDDPADRRNTDQEALEPLAGLVGNWRGVGMVQRNVQKGAWKEAADWSWKLTRDSAALELKLEEGKYLKSAVVRPGPKSGEFSVEATLADGSSRTFVGTFNDRKQLVATASGKPGDGPGRITLSPLHDTRFLMLLEAPEGARNWKRLGEVGYTREGVAFAAGDSAPVCIVTGGRGTIAVKHKGETYYVCCSGCKQLFDDDPEGVIAQAKAKKK
jgi:YHS domain-containing protein